MDRAVLFRRFVEASRRAEIVALVNSARTAAEVARVTVEELSEALDAEIGFVVVIRPDRDERELIGHVGLRERDIAAVAADPLCASASAEDRPVLHAGEDVLGLGARRAMLAPWAADDGRRIVLGVARLDDVPFDAAERALLEAVAASVGHALERAWMSAERDRHAARQAALARAAKSLTASLVGREVLETLCSEVAAALEADVALVYGDRDDGASRVVAASGDVEADLAPLDALCAEVLRDGAPRFLDDAPGADPSPAWSALAAPIRIRDEVQGVVLVGYGSPRRIEPDDVELLTAFADLAAAACRNAADHAAARRAASLDSLTGCLNHGAFQERLREEISRASRTGGSLALALIDLDDFKSVNDTLGHLAGDALLRGVAAALRRSVRRYDQVGRYGGDEFAILLPGTGEATARAILDRAVAALATVSVPGGAVAQGSAGLAQWQGDDATGLIARADAALLEEKRARGGGRRAGARVAEQHSPAAAPPESAGLRAARLARRLDERAIAETALVELGAALQYQRCVLVRRDPGGGLTVVAAAAEEGNRAEPLLGVTVGDAVRRCVRERRSILARGPGGCELAVPVPPAAEPWGALDVRARALGDDDVALVLRAAEDLGAALGAAGAPEPAGHARAGPTGRR